MINKNILFLFIATCSIALFGMESQQEVSHPMIVTLISPDEIEEQGLPTNDVMWIIPNGAEFIIIAGTEDTSIPGLPIDQKKLLKMQESCQDRKAFYLNCTKGKARYVFKIKHTDFQDKLLSPSKLSQQPTAPQKPVKPATKTKPIIAPARNSHIPKPPKTVPSGPFNSPNNTYKNPYPQLDPLATDTQFIDYLGQLSLDQQHYVLYHIRKMIGQKNKDKQIEDRDKLAGALQNELDAITNNNDVHTSDIIMQHYGANQGEYQNAYPLRRGLTTTPKFTAYMNNLTPDQQNYLIQKSSEFITKENADAKKEHYQHLSSLLQTNLKTINMKTIADDEHAEKEREAALDALAIDLLSQHYYHQKNDPDLTLENFLQKLYAPIRALEQQSEMVHANNNPDSLTNKFTTIRNKAERHTQHDQAISEKFNKRTRGHEKNIKFLETELQQLKAINAQEKALAPLLLETPRELAWHSARECYGSLVAAGIVSLFTNSNSIDEKTMKKLAKKKEWQKEVFEENNVEKQQKDHDQDMLDALNKNKKKISLDKPKKMTKEELSAAIEKRLKESHE